MFFSAHSSNTSNKEEIEELKKNGDYMKEDDALQSFIKLLQEKDENIVNK